MESVDSSPTPPPPPRRRRGPPGQPFADRVVRALHHRLLLLHRRDRATFFVLGATANVYAVTLSPTPTCTCPDRAAPCKHILFVLIRVLGVPLSNPCLRRCTLRPCQLSHLLSSPTLPHSLAAPSLRRRFHQLFFHPPPPRAPTVKEEEFEEGTACPVCLEEMRKGAEKVVACRACHNAIHEECLLRWKRSGGRQAASCVLCRARWRDRAGPAARAEAEKYLNLAAYVDEEVGNDGDDHHHHHEEDLCGTGCN